MSDEVLMSKTLPTFPRESASGQRDLLLRRTIGGPTGWAVGGAGAVLAIGGDPVRCDFLP